VSATRDRGGLTSEAQRQGAQALTRGAQGQCAQTLTDVRISEQLDRGRTFAMGHTKVYGSVTDTAPSMAAKSPETGQTASEGGLGSSVRAGTGEEGPANSLAGLQSRERDQRRENGVGEVLQAGRATPTRNPDHGEGDSGALRPGLAPAG
jgi:hypothetical protein